MAARSARVKQRADAVERLVMAANAVTDALGLDPVEIPTRHKDLDYLPTLQIDAVAGLLEQIAGSTVDSAPDPDDTDETVEATPDDAPDVPGPSDTEADLDAALSEIADEKAANAPKPKARGK